VRTEVRESEKRIRMEVRERERMRVREDGSERK